MTAFDRRARATHKFREWERQDERLVAEMTQWRMSLDRRLHDRRMEFDQISDAQLEAACEMFKTATLALVLGSPDRAVDCTTCSRLIAALLVALSQG